ncbi:MAG: bifunctional diaminohydroxyphosphoribosylaminopyrimidine deaminase/5-amino-6-(5-phosphoribosylamino)uracil reductase RibD [Hyphomicrobium sp.]
MDSRFSIFDSDMMKIALRMAKRGLGRTAPNPSVGAVIANEKTKEVISRGWTQKGGRPHAETEALRNAGTAAADATLYVTLEPCAHFGVTPPCVDAIISSKIKRVVVALMDPDPRTSGSGLQTLRNANIDVCFGLLTCEAKWITMGHILRKTEKRPSVSLKIATDQSGSVPSGNGSHPQFVTGNEARAAGHLLRSQADAILVGSGTLYDDNPELSCRLPGLNDCSPIRIVLCGSRKIPLDCRLVQTAKKLPLLLIYPGHERNAFKEFVNLGVEPIETISDQAEVSIPAVLELLAERGITRILVEGGRKVWRSFSKIQKVDEIYHFHACSQASAEQSKAILEDLLFNFNYNLFDLRKIGADTLFHWRRPCVMNNENQNFK